MMQKWIARLVAAAVLAACTTGTDDPPPLDASLTRDLSLASAEARVQPSAFGDTAAGAPAAATSESASAPAASSASGRTPAPRPQPEARPAPSRRAPPVTRVPTAAPTPAPTPTPAAEVAPTPAPDASAGPTGSEPAPTPATKSRTLLAAGTELVGATGTRVCNTTNRPGDRVVMRLSSEVTGPDGTRLAAGTPVLLELAAATDSVLTFRVKSVSLDGELYPMTGSATVESEMEGSRVAGGSDKKKVIGGAIAGAILGQVLGRNTKGTVIGAAGGAAAGAVLAARSGSTEQCLAAGSTVRVVVLEPVVTTTGADEGAGA